MLISKKDIQSEVCCFSEWEIEKQHRKNFVECLAYLYLREEENAVRVIHALEPKRHVTKGKIAQNVVSKLTAPKQEDIELEAKGNSKEQAAAKERIKTSIWHRDGLLFQHISWIAARQAFQQGYMTAPHVRQADKGFDGFIIELDDKKKIVERIILCEDKASETPRKIVTQGIWPEIEEIRRGERDDEILADLVTLLKTIPNLDTEAAVDEVLWDEVREYRIAIATSEHRRKAGSFIHVVDGFDAVAGGVLESRVGGVLPFKNLRDGLDCLARDVIAEVKKMSDV